MAPREDLYPTRLQEARVPFSRKDPIVHARNEYRWDGAPGRGGTVAL